MNITIDTAFDVYSDTPQGRDPDSYSSTLRRYHQALWSKQLPTGEMFELSTDHPRAYLHRASQMGEFWLSSDSLGHSYRYVKAMAPIIRQMPKVELDEFFAICSTIGGYIVFPSRRIEGKPTINGARGMHAKIKDRFDLTLECIRRHYERQESPLSQVLSRYADFFDLFGNFAGYVGFFLLQDLVSDDGASVDFFLPFLGFDQPPLPSSVDEYRAYQDALTAFITARNARIAEYAERAE